MRSSVERAVEILRSGKPVLLYDFDGREEEVDMVVRGDFVDPRTLRIMRKEGGGLICFVTTYDIAKSLGLRFQTEILRDAGFGDLLKRPSYGDEPAFTLYVNHVGVKTGIRDVDRALTIRELSKVVKVAWEGDLAEARRLFEENFYSPGHVPILAARIGRRWGHTELSAILAILAGIPPALAIVEMLNDDGGAKTVDEARKFAEMMGTVLISGEDVVRAWFASE